MNTENADLQTWFNARYPAMAESSLSFKDAWRRQILFVRDNIHRVLTTSYETRKGDGQIQVVSTHTSKSCELPVYHIHADNGIEIYLRGNFYNWRVSVRSPIAVPDVFFRLFDHHDENNPIYFEGFHHDWVFGSYAENKKEFSLELPYAEEYLFTFMYLLSEGVRAVNTQLDLDLPPQENS